MQKVSEKELLRNITFPHGISGLHQSMHAEFELPDGKVVVCSRPDPEIPISYSTRDYFLPGRIMALYLQLLLSEGTPFVTRSGYDDEVCTLIWELRKA